jgi:Cof subfamily protein (haloacid dehalogenase superfamily)
MSYRLLVCDIDDTLVRFPNSPSPRTRETIRAARAAGVTVALATGRAFRRARPIAQTLDIDTPIICNHGGSIRDARTGEMIHRETMPRALTRRIVSWLQTQQVHILIFDGDLVYHDCGTDEVVPDFQIYTQGEQSIFCRDLLQVLPERTEIILATSDDREYLAHLSERAWARFHDKVRVLYTHPHGLDVMPESSKSQAVAWLARQLNIPPAQVMAVGDGSNDVDMLAWAGLGVAIGDGSPEALAAADIVAPSFEQDGLAWAVERYILSPAN